jgi:dihydrofolate synthase / folylpolyglutamate synthase
MIILMNTEKDYNQALDYLYSFVDYSLKKSAELARAEFNLERMREMMAAIGNPERDYSILHVAGTKGKGSTCALMASALQAGGYKTGLYTSPHLQDYSERIQVNGKPIPHAELVRLVERVKPHVAGIPKITTFEITTAMGLLYFSLQKVDVAVVEVGLGGRLDATNIVDPLVSIITSLSYDHMAVLGNTLEKIAGEKAGIIKEGKPVVSSPQVDEALQVLETTARHRNSPFTLVGRDFQYSMGEHTLEGQTFSIGNSTFRIPLLGRHQVINAVTAYAGIKASGLPIEIKAMAKGFETVRWPCRFELIRRSPPVVLDSAHNADSADRLRQTLDDYFPNLPVICIFAVLEDKDAISILRNLQPRVDKLIATRADHPRALELEKLIGLANEVGIPVVASASASEALQKALDLAGGNQLILVAGSVAFAGEMRTLWAQSHRIKG